MPAEYVHQDVGAIAADAVHTQRDHGVDVLGGVPHHLAGRRVESEQFPLGVIRSLLFRAQRAVSLGQGPIDQVD